jgi:hypothetical protein
MIHELKVHPQFWQALLDGIRPFELRRNDRNYQVGQLARFYEYDPKYGATGKLLMVKIIYILKPEDCPGLMPGFCILGISHDIS